MAFKNLSFGKAGIGKNLFITWFAPSDRKLSESDSTNPMKAMVIAFDKRFKFLVKLNKIVFLSLSLRTLLYN